MTSLTHLVECIKFLNMEVLLSVCHSSIGTESLFPVRHLRAPGISCKGSSWTR